MKNIQLSVVAITTLLALCALACTYEQPAHAAVDPTFVTLGTHPEASSQPTLRGQTIHDLAIVDNQVFMGYGDYDANTGPIQINPFDIASNSFEGSILTVPTEEINTWRLIGGKLYAPMIDSSTGINTSIGYAVRDESGAWSNNTNVVGVHIFDIATLDGDDLWIVGSSNDQVTGLERGATAFRSTDGGQTWSIAMTDQTSPYDNYTGFERYYWVAELGGQIYMKALGAASEVPLRSFDGTTWQEGSTNAACNANEAHRVAVFAGSIVCAPQGTLLTAFDGDSIRSINPPISIGVVHDFYVDDGLLYILGEDTIVRTADLVSWERVSATPAASASIAIHDDYIYIGTSDSNLVRSGITITEAMSMPAASVSPTACFEFDEGAATITDYYNFEDNNPANNPCPKDVSIPAEINGVAVETIGFSAFSNNQLRSVVVPDSVVTIQPYAFSRNYITSVTLGDNVETIGHTTFSYNQITSVVIPDKVTYLWNNTFSYQMDVAAWGGDWNRVTADIFSGELAKVQAIADAVFYTQLYTADPSNPNNLTDQLAFQAADVSGDYSEIRRVLVGGAIVNPSMLTIQYRDTAGNVLASAVSRVGVSDEGVAFSDYYASNGPSMPVAADPWNPTNEEQQRELDALSVYYKLGDIVTVEPLVIPGYITPPAQTFVLGAATNEQTFVYASTSDGNAEATDPATPNGEAGDGELADTGANQVLLILVAAGLLSIGTGTVLVGRRYS